MEADANINLSVRAEWEPSGKGTKTCGATHLLRAGVQPSDPYLIDGTVRESHQASCKIASCNLDETTLSWFGRLESQKLKQNNEYHFEKFNPIMVSTT